MPKNNWYTYAPADISRYELRGLRRSELDVIKDLDPMFRQAAWNLFWLSTPSLDKVLDAGDNWRAHYTAQIGALKAIIGDVIGDEVLMRKLLMHPDHFQNWFEFEDHSIFDTFDALGGDAWVISVLERADIAAHRIYASKEFRFVNGKFRQPPEMSGIG